MSGSPPQIHAEAAAFRRCGTVASDAATVIASLALSAWTGEAGDAYRDRRATLRSTVNDHAADLAAVATVLDDYATALAPLLAEIERIRAGMRAAWDALISLPPDLTAVGDLITAQRALRSALLRKAQLADHAAENIYARVSDTDPAVPGYTWPPDGWPLERPWDTAPLPPDILDTSTFDPRHVSQGGIGDCYLISTLMTLMRTPEGDALLRQNVRWDPEAGGYWVTLYVDGKPTPFFVDHAITGGATENDKAGLVTIYEAAMRDYLSYADLHDGGVASDVYPLITGQDASQTKAPDGGWDLGDLHDEFADSGYMVASASEVDSVNAPEMITVQRETPYGTYYTETVEIIGPHAYAVVAVTDEGVWLMNPHGAGNRVDGGGSFLVSPEDFDRLFWRVSVGEVAS